VKAKAVRIWDNGGETVDRYTIAIKVDGGWDVYGMAQDPKVFNQFSHSTGDGYKGPGSRVLFSVLPESVQKAVADRMKQ
jgi:hypothetical protein